MLFLHDIPIADRSSDYVRQIVHLLSIGVFVGRVIMYYNWRSAANNSLFSPLVPIVIRKQLLQSIICVRFLTMMPFSTK